MRVSIGRAALVAVIAVLATGTLATQASAFFVAADSQGNRLYLVISQRDVNSPLENISIQVSPPAGVSAWVPLFTPGSVPSASGRMGGVAFDVAFDAPPGGLDNLVVTVQGTVNGQVVIVTTNVPLEVAGSAPPLQGTIGDPSAVPGLEALETDGDGFPDLEEIAVRSDPFDPTSTPATLVPALSPAVLATLALLLFGMTLWLGRMRRVR
jgi:hypothetical protein